MLDIVLYNSRLYIDFTTQNQGSMLYILTSAPYVISADRIQVRLPINCGYAPSSTPSGLLYLTIYQRLTAKTITSDPFLAIFGIYVNSLIDKHIAQAISLCMLLAKAAACKSSSGNYNNRNLSLAPHSINGWGTLEIWIIWKAFNINSPIRKMSSWKSGNHFLTSSRQLNRSELTPTSGAWQDVLSRVYHINIFWDHCCCHCQFLFCLSCSVCFLCLTFVLHCFVFLFPFNIYKM